jgi:predicted TIM-barrel fold metal-dependent hydrolase
MSREKFSSNSGFAPCRRWSTSVKGNLFFSTKADDVLLPQVIELVGDDNIVFGSDMPHGDREPFVVHKVQGRKGYQRHGEAKDSRNQSGAALRARGLSAAGGMKGGA